MFNLSAVILAGGESSRMGQDKGLMRLQGKTMVEHVADRFAAANQLLINSDNDEYEKLGFDLISDIHHPDVAKQAGPLMGIYSGLKLAKHDWVIFSPCDTPFIPQNYIEKMCQTASDQLVKACVVFDGERQQNLHILLHNSHAEGLLMYLLSGRRKTYEWLDSIKAQQVYFTDSPAAFDNINTPEDFAAYSK